MKTDKPDVDVKSMAPLSVYGRDEEYMDNKLWLDGISSLILKGVGDGMVPWCAVKKRIPIMCLYETELHKKTIEVFLVEKIAKKMEEATPKDTRWYRTAAQLGCREAEDNEEAAKTRAEQAKAAAAAKAKALAGKRANEGGGGEGESQSSSGSSSSSKKRKTGKEDD